MAGDARSANGDQQKDIVDHLSEATGYFHDSEAEKLRVIAKESGQKPVGVVKAAVEKEIDRREWKAVYFDHEEDREYPSSNAHEYYRIHKSLQLEYEAAEESLPTVERRLKEYPALTTAAETLQDKAREHRAKAEMAKRYLEENGLEVPDVDPPVADEEEVTA